VLLVRNLYVVNHLFSKSAPFSNQQLTSTVQLTLLHHFGRGGAPRNFGQAFFHGLLTGYAVALTLRYS
jgi:hypothetical protein